MKKAFNMRQTSTPICKKQRIEKHMTIKQVANAVGISVDTLMRIEQNKYDLHNADKLRKSYNILDLNTKKSAHPISCSY